MQATAADERRQQQQQARMAVWRAVPVLRRIMGFLPGAQRVALLDADGARLRV